MKLNAMMIYEAVRGKSDVMILGKCQEERTLRFVGFFDGNTETMTAGGIYLTENERLHRKVPEQIDILWVVWGGEPPVAIPKCPVLYFTEEKDPKKILNLIQAVFVRFDIWEEEIDRILKEKNNISRMIEVSEPLFRYPLCVVDTSLNYLGYSSSFMSKGKEVFFPDRESLLDRRDEDEDGIKRAALFYDREQDRTLPL